MILINITLAYLLNKQISKTKVILGIRKFSPGGVELVNGDILDTDLVILVTGYGSNILSWLKLNLKFSFLIRFLFSVILFLFSASGIYIFITKFWVKFSYSLGLSCTHKYSMQVLMILISSSIIMVVF